MVEVKLTGCFRAVNCICDAIHREQWGVSEAWLEAL
jgi:hypothetical protein